MTRKSAWPPRIYFHKPSGQDRIRWGGRDYWLGAHGSPESRERYARLVAELAAGVPQPAKAETPLTVAEVAAAWGTHAARALSERGNEAYHVKRALAPVLRLYASLPAKDFGVVQLEVVQMAMATGSWQDDAAREMLAKQGKQPGWCRNVVNHAVSRIRTVWRWAERRGLVPKGSAAHLGTLPALGDASQLARRTERRASASWPDLLTVCRHAGPVLRTMLLLQWWSGMRPGEVRIMRTCDLDRSGPVWVYTPFIHKCDWRGQPRTVALGVKCQALLRRWLRPDDPEAYLFLTQRGNPFSMASYSESVRRVALAAGVPGFCAYQMRHSAKDRVTRSEGIDVARCFLGQKTLQTTMGYGQQIDVQQAIEAARKLA